MSLFHSINETLIPVAHLVRVVDGVPVGGVRVAGLSYSLAGILTIVREHEVPVPHWNLFLGAAFLRAVVMYSENAGEFQMDVCGVIINVSSILFAVLSSDTT